MRKRPECERGARESPEGTSAHVSIDAKTRCTDPIWSSSRSRPDYGSHVTRLAYNS